MNSVVAALLLLLAPAAGSEQPGKTTYYFGTNPARTDVAFSSQTAITNILGTTKTLQGSATVDFDAGSGDCHLIVPVKTLNTGMADRDRAMFNETWMNEAEHKTIEFKSTNAVKKSARSWEIAGKFLFRGVWQDMTIAVDVVPLPDRIGKRLGEGSWIRVKTEFNVDITAHGLKIPEKSLATVNKIWRVAINIFGTTAKPANAPVAAAPEQKEVDLMALRKVRAKRVDKDGLPGKLYRFGMRKQFTTISAISKMELETVVAQSSVIGGYAGIDLEKGTGEVRLNISVYSLKTGIEKRDQKMVGELWLDGAKHKYIEFQSTKATLKGKDQWEIEGNMTIKGVSKPLTLQVRMKEIPKELIESAGYGNKPALGFSTEFTIKLSDFGVKIPDISVANVNDEWTIKLDLKAVQQD